MWNCHLTENRLMGAGRHGRGGGSKGTNFQVQSTQVRGVTYGLVTAVTRTALPCESC